MRHMHNPKTRKGDGDSLGENKNHNQKLSEKPAPRDADHESDTTPPENEVYIDIEPDELHPDEEPLDVDEKA